MKVVILGTGCPRCRDLEALVRKAVEESGRKDVVIESVDDIVQIVEYGVMSTPALIVDGKLKCYGRIPKAGELLDFLK